MKEKSREKISQRRQFLYLLENSIDQLIYMYIQVLYNKHARLSKNIERTEDMRKISRETISKRRRWKIH